MTIERFWVGDIECHVLIHGRGSGTPEWMFPTAPPDRRAELMSPYLDAAGEFAYVYASLVVRDGPTIALLDTGPPDPAGGPTSLDAALADLAIDRDAVAVVVLTHGHVDHLGGLISQGRPALPRARHYLHQRELDHWTTGAEAGGMAAELLGPVVDAGLVDAVHGDVEIAPGLRVLSTPGHTPGHLAVAITSGDDSALYVGDVLAHEANVAEPGWNHFSDQLAAPAARSRRRLVERAVRDDSIVVGSHLSTWGRPSAFRSPAAGPRPGVGAR